MKFGLTAHRAVSLVAALAVPFLSAALSVTSGGIAAVTASAADTASSGYIQNGSFEAPVFSKVYNRGYDYKNYSITDTADPLDPDAVSMRSGTAWMVSTKYTYDNLTNNQFYWNTTASNRRIEVVDASKSIGTYLPDGSGAAHGNQFAELVAEEESSLYQNLDTIPGSTITWSLSHRARLNTTATGKNSMAVFVGKEQEGLTKASSTSNDIFKQMALLLYEDFDSLPVKMTERAVKLYSKPVYDGMTIDESCVSMSNTNGCTEEWFCWIITSDTQAWYEHSDSYEVPSGQTRTTLAFAALNGGKDGQEYINAGNLIDDIRFSTMNQLTVSSIDGGHGTVKYYNDDILSQDIVTAETSPYIRNFETSTDVKILAVPDNDYAFVGALVDGEYKNVSDFTDNGDSTYSYKVSMDEEHSVSLYFAKKAYVVYDPNNGRFSGVGEPTVNKNGQSEYSITQALPLNQTSAPINGDKEFVGWRVFSDGNRTEDMGVFIPAEHVISYVQSEKLFVIEYNGKNLTVPTTNDTILFVAEYRNKLSIQSCYVGVDKTVVHNDWAGGTAQISLEGGEPSSDSVGIYNGQRYTVKATPKPGYEFKGWYYTFDSENGQENQKVHVISETKEKYSGIFAFNENVTIHAQFVEIAVSPILYVIPENPSAEDVLESEGIVSTDGTQYTQGYGGSVYGNTIATSFYIKRDFTGTTKMPGGVWTIYLPVNGTYMKVPETDNRNDYDHVDFENAVVSDKTNTDKQNFGKIYDMKSSDDARTEKFSIYVGGHNDLTLTNATVKFGIIIDNVYAPNATAGFKVEESQPDGVAGLNDTNSIYTRYEDGDYEHDESKLDGEVVSE